MEIQRGKVAEVVIRVYESLEPESGMATPMTQDKIIIQLRDKKSMSQNLTDIKVAICEGVKHHNQVQAVKNL